MRTAYDDLPRDIAGRLRRWVDAGLIEDRHVAAIAAWEASNGTETVDDRAVREDRRASTPSTGVEALAYVGGAVIVAAITIAAAGYWEHLSRIAQVATPAAATVITVVAGALIPSRLADVGIRLRAALWLVGVAGVAVTMTVVYDILWEHARDPSLLVVAVPTWTVAAVLWLLHRAAAQQLAAFLSTCMLALALVDVATSGLGISSGAVIAAVSIGWGAAALARLLPGGGRWADAAGSANVDLPQRARFAARQRRWAAGIASVGAVVGSILLAAGWEITWLGLLPVALVVIAGVAQSDLVVLIVGAVGTVIVLPLITDRYLNSTVVTALVLLLVGTAMVALAMVVARRRGYSR